MKIGLIGYGKMGRTIEKIAEERGHEVAARINSSSSNEEWQALKSTDVCIDFTQPKGAVERFMFFIENNIPLVTGTTGWNDQEAEVRSAVAEVDATFFAASNFSIGVHLFWKVNQVLAQLMNSQKSYTVSMEEVHHTEKKDAPSGTAITTAEQIIQHRDDMDSWQLGQSKNKTLGIEAKREHDVKGTHWVHYDSSIDRISLGHEAKSREGFALGAVLAAEFTQQNRGWLSMNDLLDQQFKNIP